MNMHKRFCITLFCILAQPVMGMDFDPEIIEVSLHNNNRTMLIFLDDSESDDAERENKMGAISGTFFCAFGQQAGPIIISASVIDNLRRPEVPAQGDDQALVNRFNELLRKPDLDDAGFRELKTILRTAASFDDLAHLWVIKKIDDALYLLIPKQYLQSLAIDQAEVEKFIQGPLTDVEQLLGLKVNHMQTVSNLDEIKKPTPAPQAAHYFIDAIYNSTKDDPSSIFITNGEYYKRKNKNIPLWSIFIGGHGLMSMSVANLALPQFKDFLTFLLRGIHTKVLYYLSCYAAGLNSKILYEDAESGIDRNYPFAIITQAITDAPVMAVTSRLIMRDGNLSIMTFQAFNDFVRIATTSDIVDYKGLANCFVGHESLFGAGGGVLPQVKFPGLPWFSVIHEERVVSIGSILAKTRTKPLNTETFFARKGKKAAPVGILLYVLDIPFELIVNSKVSSGLPPSVISMIPGNVLHHIKKISSQIHSVENLLLSFLQLKGLGPQKIFIIDEVTGKKGWLSTVTVKDVVIALSPQQNTMYYIQNGLLFKNNAQKTDADDLQKYERLIALTKPLQGIISDEAIMRMKAQAEQLFMQKKSAVDVYGAITKLLDAMSNGMVMHIPKIKAISCPPTEGCWLELLVNLARYAGFGAQKIIVFDELELYNAEDQTFVFLKDIIIDVEEADTTVWATLPSGQSVKASIKTGMMQADDRYATQYRIMIDYFNVHKQMPQRVKKRIVSMQDLLTSSAIERIKKVQEQKAQKIGAQRLQDRTTKREQNRSWWWMW